MAREHAGLGRPFALLMLIPNEPDSLDTKQSLIASAQWLDDLSPRQAVDRILVELIERIGSTTSEAFGQIARITVISTQDPFVQSITMNFPVTGSELVIEHCTFNGTHIERAVVLESRRPASV